MYRHIDKYLVKHYKRSSQFRPNVMYGNSDDGDDNDD